jgi:hypothetical protein
MHGAAETEQDEEKDEQAVTERRDEGVSSPRRGTEVGEEGCYGESVAAQ